MDTATDQAVEDEIRFLEDRLVNAKARRRRSNGPVSKAPASSPSSTWMSGMMQGVPTPNNTHTLLLLSDSALPLGSFAFSSGLESYLAHRHSQPKSPIADFHHFLRLSLASMASTTLPYVLAAYRHPSILSSLTCILDAVLFCPVARRASIAQGKALLTIWERSYARVDATPVNQHLKAFRELLRIPSTPSGLGPVAHFPPLWGVLTAHMGLSAHQAAYVFLLGHVKAVLSAAVRASVMGPYQAQGILANPATQNDICAAVERGWNVEVEDAGQVAPVLDLWMGRHELLYSRIFNS